MQNRQQFHKWVQAQTDPQALYSAVERLGKEVALDGQTPIEPDIAQERIHYIARKAPVLSRQLIERLSNHPDHLEALSTNTGLSNRQGRFLMEKFQAHLGLTLPSRQDLLPAQGEQPLSFYATLEALDQAFQNLRTSSSSEFQPDDIDFLMSWLNRHLKQAQQNGREAGHVRLREVFERGLPWLHQMTSSMDAAPSSEAINELVDNLRTCELPVIHYSSRLILAPFSGPEVWRHALEVSLNEGQQAPPDWEQLFYNLASQTRVYKHPDILEQLRQLGQPSIYRQMLNRLDDPKLLGEVLEELSEIADTVAAAWVSQASLRRLSRIPLSSFSCLLNSPRNSVRDRVFRRLRDLPASSKHKPPSPPLR